MFNHFHRLNQWCGHLEYDELTKLAFSLFDIAAFLFSGVFHQWLSTSFSCACFLCFLAFLFLVCDGVNVTQLLLP